MTNVTRRIEIVGKSVGLENLKSKLNDVAAAQGGVAVSADQMSRAHGSSESRINRLQRSLDANFRSQEAIARATRTADSALSQGLISQSRHTELLDLATQKYQANSVAAVANARATRGAASAAQAMAAANRANSFQLRNLQFQMMDIAQGIPLLFQSPTHGLLNIANQGAQISQIYGPGEGGAARALREAAAMAGRFAARLGPIAVAAGVASLGIVGLQNDIEATTGASVSFGDVINATLQELAASVMSGMSPAFEWLGRVVNATGDLIFDALKTIGNAIINTFEFSYLAVVATWEMLPSALGDLVLSAAQKVVDGTESMINGVIEAVNGLPQEWLPERFRINIGEVDLPDIANPFAGAASGLGSAYEEAYAVFQNNRVGDFFTRVGERAAAMTDEVEGASRSLNGFESAVQSIERATQGLWDQANFFGEENRYDLLEYQKTQELLNAAMDAGVRITDAVRERISGLASDYVSAVQNLDLLNEAQERFAAVVDFTKKTFSSFFSDFSNQLQQGASVWDAFKTAGLNALNSILSKVLEMASNNLVMSLFGGGNMGGGGGLLGGLLGSFGGFFAGGGVLGAGQWGIAGERGPEPIVGPARIISNDNYMRSANSNAPQPVVINQTNYINNPFGMEGVARAIQEGNARAVGQATNASVAKVSNIQRRTGRPLG